MALGDLTVKEFLAKTASNAAVPGGGSVAALSAAVAASLSEMVANLTLGKAGFEPVEAEMKEIVTHAGQYREKLVKAIDRDSDAFTEVLAAYKLPKHTEEAQRERSGAIQEALKNASSVPLNVSEDALAVLELAGRALKKGNENAVTDGAVAVMMARTAVLSALYNVKINLVSVTDEAFVNEIETRIDAIGNEAEKKEKEILSSIDL
jgi:formiminotetrahydrofolate cyclodeaminase